MEYYKNLSLEPIEYFCEFDLVWKIEEWKDVPNYFGLYQISDLGRVKSLSRIIFRKGKYPFKSKEFILIGGFSKSNNGYRNVSFSLNGSYKSYTIHQLVAISFLGHIPCGFDLVVNHKNFIRTDNRKLNLEIVTNRENTNKNNVSATSKFIGVYWLKSRRKWVARIRIGKEHKYLGIFKNEEDASKAYNDKLNEIIKKIK